MRVAGRCSLKQVFFSASTYSNETSSSSTYSIRCLNGRFIHIKKVGETVRNEYLASAPIHAQFRTYRRSEEGLRLQEIGCASSVRNWDIRFDPRARAGFGSISEFPTDYGGPGTGLQLLSAGRSVGFQAVLVLFRQVTRDFPSSANCDTGLNRKQHVRDESS